MTDGYPTPADAERAFYRAFERADAAAMAGVWDDGPDIVCIHPLGPLLTGAAAVMGSWRALLGGGGGMRFSIRVHQAYETGDFAVRIVAETIHVVGEAEPRPPVLATNAYRRRDGAWRMVLHHGSPQPWPAETRKAEPSQRKPSLH